MTELVEEILALTIGIKEALGCLDITLADDLLSKRGNLLKQLADIWPVNSTPPSQLVVTLVEVKKLDADMEADLSQRRDSIGTEINRLAQRAPQKKHGTHAPCILNRHA